ncbi:MAG TPA: FKBP-type peptidyl-prolyl cis-trans isomerase [Myxococcota bacterium]|nr:FKBP-type peptidyl-prolyl cis-trans isomerase [Myxococcota bacterium]
MFARRIATLGPLLASLACAGPPRADGWQETDLPRADPGVLYAIGASLGKQVKDYHLDEEEAREVARGMLDETRGRSYTGMRTEGTSDQIADFNERRLQELARREELAGAPALESAAREPGAVKTESGMVLQVLDKGSGEAPTIFDYVTINYHGTLRDGNVFWSNRGQAPYRVQLGTTTRCWQEAFAAVAPGARLHVVCPPSLNYGWGGWPGVVPGGAVLSYDLELLSVEPHAPPPNWSPG